MNVISTELWWEICSPEQENWRFDSLIAIVGDKLHPQFDFSLASFQNHFGKKSNLSSIHYDMLAHLCKCVI